MNTQKRTYTLRKRADAVENTRQRIIEASITLFSENGYPGVSMDNIVEAAGVSRQTVYVQFGSKRGVLQALSDHVERASFGPIGTNRPTASSDPLAMLSDGCRRMMHFYDTNSQFLRTLRAQAAYDSDVHEVWVRGMNNHRFAIYSIMQSLASEEKLAAGWSVDEATDWLAAVAHFNTYDYLFNERGWTSDQINDHIMSMVSAMLLVGDGRLTTDDG